MVKPTIDSRPRKKSREKAAPAAYPGARELAWFESDPPELEQHRGRYVAIIGERVVLSAASPAELVKALNDSGLSDAFIERVPTERFTGYFIG